MISTLSPIALVICEIKASAFADGDICELRLTSALLTDKVGEAAGDGGVAMAIALG